MSTGTRLLLVLSPVLFAVTILLASPRIARRGLLFGVYVGEGPLPDEATRITRSWYRRMLLLAAASVGIGTWLVLVNRPLLAIFAPVLVLLSGFHVLTEVAARRARSFAAPPPSVAAAPLVPVTPHLTALTLLLLTLATAIGIFAVAHAWASYSSLPDVVPTGFSLSGRPASWGPRTFTSVMISPLIALDMGLALGILGWLFARAKRTLRYPDPSGASLRAQMHFQESIAVFLGLLAVVVSGVLTVISVEHIRIAQGVMEVMMPPLIVLKGIVAVVGLAGLLFIMFRYGQGGSRIEAAAADASLTDGLADNRFWGWGPYINREDPALMIEARFGLGYAFNLGNWKAVVVLLLLLLLFVVFPVAAILAMSNRPGL